MWLELSEAGGTTYGEASICSTLSRFVSVMARTLAFLRTHSRSLLGGFLLLVLAGLWFVDWSNPPNLVLFAGSFHPVLVHFPIGLLILAALLELLHRYEERFSFLEPAVPVVLLLGTVSAVAAVGAGWFLSLTGGYQESILGWHRWLGIGVAIGGAAAWLLGRECRRESPRVPFVDSAYLAVLLITVSMVGVTGHLGGSLTHGAGFLTRYLPDPVAGWVGGSGYGRVSQVPTPVDSAYVYRDLIQPVLQDRCVECHGSSTTEGGLRLDGREYIVEGGDDGTVIQPGSPDESALVERVTLPLYHDDRMPPEGHEPLSVERTELLRWWIANGASFDARVADIDEEATPTSVKTVLARLSRPSEEVRTGIYAEDVAPPDSSVIVGLADAPLRIRRMSGSDPFLEVEFTAAVDTVGPELLSRLEGLAPQIAWLDLSGTVVPAESFEVIGGMPHLTRLYLQDARIEESGLRELEECRFLEYVNLVASNVSDEGLAYLSSVNSLRTIYLWKTDVTDPGVDSLRAHVSGVEVNRGASLVVRDSTSVDTVRTDTVSV